jgi:hypothetical protein
MNLLQDNNAGYLFTAYGVFLGALTVYFVSLFLRRRALDRDEQIIEQVEQEEKNK